MISVNIFKINEDGTGTLVETVLCVNSDAAMVIMHSKKDADGGTYSAEVICLDGTIVIGQV
jgi:hypothetical protein